MPPNSSNPNMGIQQKGSTKKKSPDVIMADACKPLHGTNGQSLEVLQGHVFFPTRGSPCSALVPEHSGDQPPRAHLQRALAAALSAWGSTGPFGYRWRGRRGTRELGKNLGRHAAAGSGASLVGCSAVRVLLLAAF